MKEENFSKGEKRRFAASAAREIAYVALATALITVCAWISLPIGPVPFTLQTLAVALIGALLGKKRSFFAVLVYILLGLVGIPVFAGFKSGVAALFGATGGYIFGFLFLAFLPALFKSLPVKGRARIAALYGGMLLGLAVCYFFGTVWFVSVYQCAVGYALAMCVIPYLVPDFVKLFAAAVLAVKLEKYVG